MKNTTLATNKLIHSTLWFFIGAYIVYFSYFSILRYKTLYSSYYDLGIMNQTVFNTYRAIVEKNPSKILEMTNPVTGAQVKRMSIHNDSLLALISLFYFIYSGPEALLILQSVVLGLGALAVFKIASQVLKKYKYTELFALIFALSYLLYPPFERSNIFDFHAVTLATTFLLWMIATWMEKKYVISFIFFLLSLLSKEQVGLTTFFFGAFAFWQGKKIYNTVYSVSVIALSIVWVILSFLVIVPHFRGTSHFAISYYGDFGDSPFRILLGIFKNPSSIIKYIFDSSTAWYFWNLFGPIGFLSLLSPLRLVIAIPEFAINLLSNNWNMRNTIFHYTAVMTPFIFLSAIYGISKLRGTIVKKAMVFLVACTLIFAYLKGPLPFSREQEIHPFRYPQRSTKEITIWAKTLKDPSLKIAATGQAAPLFSSRQYLFLFSDHYHLADYVVVTLNEIYNYPEKNILIPVFNTLKSDPRFERIYQSDNVEVYKKI